MKTFRSIFRLAVLLIFAFTIFAQAQNPKVLKDINPCIANCGQPGTGHVDGDIRSGVYYFGATNGTNGIELWRTDGTPVGTWMVKDVNPGAGNGVWNITGYADWYNGDTGPLYFSGNNGTTGFELFKTDGTAGGTTLVKNIWAESKNTINNSFPGNFIVMNGITYFGAWVSKKTIQKLTYYNSQFFRTDGTSSGTYILKDLAPTNLFGTLPGNLHVLNNILYFGANVDGYGNRLCRTDGTVNGTYMVHPTANIGAGGTGPNPLTIYNNHLFFWDCSDSVGGFKLWMSDGTQAGTSIVTTLHPTVASNSPRYPVVCNGVIYFAADGGANGYELWRSDGTSAGTYLVKDINPGSGNSDPYWITPIGNTIYFTAVGPTSDVPGAPITRQLWKSDGTASGTVLVKVINPSGNCEANTNYAYCWMWQFTPLNDKFYFRATDGEHGTELWSSDGTTAGTAIVKDINAGSANAWPNRLRVLNNKLIFWATDPNVGEELFVYDPTLPVSKQSAAIFAQRPTAFVLEQNYPNPFNPSTTINYSIPEDVHVTLKVYDVYSREVETLVDVVQKAGIYSVFFDGKYLPSGMYTYRLETEGISLTKMMTLVK